MTIIKPVTRWTIFTLGGFTDLILTHPNPAFINILDLVLAWNKNQTFFTKIRLFRNFDFLLRLF